MLLGNKPIGTIAYLGGVLSLPEEFCWNWGQMIQYNTEYMCNPGEYIHYTRAKASYHAFARNELVKEIQGDWLLMLDIDHSFEPDLALRLRYRMDKYNIDVLTGLYLYKYPPHSPVLYQYSKDGIPQPLVDWTEGADIFEVNAAGAGVLMIKRKVFDRIKEELKEEPFDIKPPFGEDHSFFKRLEDLNIKTYCCPVVESHHLGLKKYSYDEDYDKTFFEKREGNKVGGFI